MSDDKQKPRKRIRIPTPKELDESVASGQSEQDEAQGQKGGRARIRRFQIRVREGVGRNKKVQRAPRPDVPSVKEPVPDRQDTGDVEPSVRQPIPEPVLENEGDQEDARSPETDIGADPAFKDEVGEKDKQEIPSGSRIRAVKLPSEHRKKKEEPVPVPDDDIKKPKSRERIARDLARRNAQKNGHDIGDFVKQVRPDRTKQFTATCKKCDSDIVAFVTFEDFDVKGLPEVGGKAQNKRCEGESNN